MSSSFFIGRWQPFHDGHKALIQKVLDEDRSVVIAVRDTQVNDDNPYTLDERMGIINAIYQDDDRVTVISIPDIAEVCHGRDVGWDVRRIYLDDEIEEISATNIRRTSGKKQNGV